MSARSRRRHRRTSRKRNPFLAVLLVLGSMLAVGVLGSGLWLLSVYNSAPSLASLTPIKEGTVSKVYAADGSLLGVIHSDKIRQPIASARIPEDLKNATVAIEDRRFYSHGGIDPSAIVRAGWEDLTAGGKPVEGGSTITQQLVRNLYIQDPEDTLKRKIIEARLANDEEDQHSQGLDPDRVPEHRLLRDQRGRHRDRGRGGGRDLLLQARRGSDPARGGDDRRPAAGALPVQPAAQPAGGARPGATRCCTRWSSRATSPRPSTQDGDRPGPRPRPGTASTAGSASPTSSTSSSRSSRTATG